MVSELRSSVKLLTSLRIFFTMYYKFRKRDDGMKININKSLAVSEWENDTLEMTSVSRVDIGAYLCIASVSISLFNDYNQL